MLAGRFETALVVRVGEKPQTGVGQICNRDQNSQTVSRRQSRLPAIHCRSKRLIVSGVTIPTNQHHGDLTSILAGA
jgi:hypothetical protein